MNKVKIAKYTKEKRAEAGRKYREEQKKMKYGTAVNMLYVLGDTWRTSRGLFAATLINVVMSMANALCLTFTDKLVIEFALDMSPGTGLTAAAVIAGGQLATFFMYCCSLYSSMVGSYSYSYSLYNRLMRKKMYIKYEKTEDPRVSDMLRKADTAANVISNSALDMLGDTMIAALNALSFGGILSMLSPLLVLVIGVPTVARYYINKHKMQWVWNMADNWQTFDRQLKYITYIGTDSDYSAAKDIRIFGMQRWLEKVYDRVFAKRLNWYEQQDEWSWRHDVLGHIVAATGTFAAYIYVIWLVIDGQIGAGDFVLYFNSIFMLSDAIRQWCDKISAFQWLSNNVCYLRGYLEQEDCLSAPAGKALPEGQCEIEFRNVSYTYSGAEEPTIKKISFRLNKGERLAMVGLNGAGKTTLIKLMCGLYEPTEGEILLNGTPISEFSRLEYFGLFSTVFQDITVLPVSIAENISSRKAEETDYERVCDCMKKSGIYEKVMSLPEKEHTRLCKTVYDDATDLSGGQMQKLALAKALYKDAPVLLLDEPTAALDPIAEQEMYLSYSKFAKDKSSVFISHRLASTRFCDRIILIADGGIAEEGTHEDLMRLGGTYAELFEIQSSYYKEEGERDDL